MNRRKFRPLQKPTLGTAINWSCPLASGLRGVWLLGERSGTTVNNAAIPGATGTLSGSTPPSWGSSPYGSALTFNGSTGYVSAVGSTADFGFLASTAVFTISARIRLADNTADAAGAILGGTASSSNKDASLFWENRSAVSSPKALRVLVGSGGGPGTFTLSAQTDNNIITDNLWHHVTAVGNRTTTAVYVDGVAAGMASNVTQASPAGPLTAAPDVGRLTSSAMYFNGDVEHVCVWDRALSAADAAALYANPYAIFMTPPIPLFYGFTASSSGVFYPRPCVAYTPDPTFLFEE